MIKIDGNSAAPHSSVSLVIHPGTLNDHKTQYIATHELESQRCYHFVDRMARLIEPLFNLQGAFVLAIEAETRRSAAASVGLAAGFEDLLDALFSVYGSKHCVSCGVPLTRGDSLADLEDRLGGTVSGAIALILPFGRTAVREPDGFGRIGTELGASRVVIGGRLLRLDSPGLHLPHPDDPGGFVLRSYTAPMRSDELRELRDDLRIRSGERLVLLHFSDAQAPGALIGAYGGSQRCLSCGADFRAGGESEYCGLLRSMLPELSLGELARYFAAARIDPLREEQSRLHGEALRRAESLIEDGFSEVRLGDSPAQFSVVSAMMFRIALLRAAAVHDTTLVLPYALSMAHASEIGPLVAAASRLSAEGNSTVFFERSDDPRFCGARHLLGTPPAHSESNSRSLRGQADYEVRPGELISVSGSERSGYLLELHRRCTEAPESARIFSSAKLLLLGEAAAPGSTRLIEFGGIAAELALLFAGTPAARERGLAAEDFVPNTTPFRCPACTGAGYRLSESEVESDARCESCEGSGFSSEVGGLRLGSRRFVDLINGSVTDLRRAAPPGGELERRTALLERCGFAESSPSCPVRFLGVSERQRLELFELLVPVYRPPRRGRRRSKPVLFLLDSVFISLNQSERLELIGALREILSGGHAAVCAENAPQFQNLADRAIEFGNGFASKETGGPAAPA